MGQLASQLFHGQVWCVISSLSQLQWADKRSRVHFKCAICIWNLLLSTVKMRSKELSLSVKQAIIRLKKQNKPIREIAKTLGVAKTTVWNILKKKERTVSSATPKTRKTTENNCGGWPKNSFPGEENTLHNSWPDQEHSPGGRCMCVKVTIKRRLHQSEYRGFTTRCKPLVSLKNRKARLEFAKRHLKKAFTVLEQHPMDRWDQDQLVPEWWEEKRMEKERKLLMILSIPPHQWSMVVVVSWRGHVWLPVELVLLYLLMMWLLTKAAGWILKCFGQYYLLIFSQMLQNSLDGTSQCRWTMTQSILQKQPKSFWRERSGLLCNGQVNHLTWIRLSMHFTCWRQNWRENAPRTSRNWRRLQ